MGPTVGAAGTHSTARSWHPPVPDASIAAHPGAPFTFVADGLPAAIERAIAGELNVCVALSTLASECLERGAVLHFAVPPTCRRRSASVVAAASRITTAP